MLFLYDLSISKRPPGSTAVGLAGNNLLGMTISNDTRKAGIDLQTMSKLMTQKSMK